MRSAAALAGAGDAQNVRTIESRYFCVCPSSGEFICHLACPEGADPRRFSELTASTTLDTLLPYPGITSPIAIEQTVRIQVI